MEQWMMKKVRVWTDKIDIEECWVDNIEKIGYIRWDEVERYIKQEDNSIERLYFIDRTNKQGGSIEGQIQIIDRNAI